VTQPHRVIILWRRDLHPLPDHPWKDLRPLLGRRWSRPRLLL